MRDERRNLTLGREISGMFTDVLCSRRGECSCLSPDRLRRHFDEVRRVGDKRFIDVWIGEGVCGDYGASL